jgi:hypothetical protein
MASDPLTKAAERKKMGKAALTAWITPDKIWLANVLTSY